MTDPSEDARRLLQTEYLVTPELVLTPGEAATLLNLGRAAALELLQALEASGFLYLTSDGRFARSDDQPRAATRESWAARRQAL